MNAKKISGVSAWVDPDDAPELTEEFFTSAEIREGDRVVRPGRPKVASPKRQVTLRLDADVLEKFKAEGPGWQTRINEALRRA